MNMPTPHLTSRPESIDSCNLFTSNAANPSISHQGKASILVVDDERLVRWFLIQKLAARGYRTEEAEDVASAVAWLDGSTREFDLVLLDMKLPDGDGIDLLARIQELHPSLPVILMTAFGSPEKRQKAVQLGARQFVEKPFDHEVMMTIVEQTLAHPLNQI